MFMMNAFEIISIRTGFYDLGIFVTSFSFKIYKVYALVQLIQIFIFNYLTVNNSYDNLLNYKTEKNIITAKIFFEI